MRLEPNAFRDRSARNASGGGRIDLLLLRWSSTAPAVSRRAYHVVIRRIVLPDVLREIWPGLVLLYITMLKMSTLASAPTVWEVLHSAESIIQRSYRTLELYLAVCIVFVVIIVPLSIAARRLERSEALRRRS
jgi:ABC-type amino acid transport system permease subunit